MANPSKRPTVKENTNKAENRYRHAYFKSRPVSLADLCAVTGVEVDLARKLLEMTGILDERDVYPSRVEVGSRDRRNVGASELVELLSLVYFTHVGNCATEAMQQAQDYYDELAAGSNYHQLLERAKQEQEWRKGGLWDEEDGIRRHCRSGESGQALDLLNATPLEQLKLTWCSSRGWVSPGCATH